MRIMGRGPVLAGALAALVVAGPVRADNNPNGIVFRAVGWFKGKANITPEKITCEIPEVGSAIADGAFAMGLWNTFGLPTLYFPDINHPYANPCGGWIQLQNNLINQGIVVTQVKLHFRIPRARRFLGVPAFRGFPLACREFRRDTLFVGARLNPSDSPQDSGAPNVAFIQLLPLVSPQLFRCLRDQYNPLPNNLFVSLPLVIGAQAVGVSDAGDTYRSNGIRYTLNLRHTCGNGRLDDGEVCDPTFGAACGGVCVDNSCAENPARSCATDADCTGTCQPQGDVAECACSY